MPSGRPRTPNEVKRLRGTARHDRGVPDLVNVVPLHQATSVPAVPDGLGHAGERLWERTWSSGLQWLSPQADIEIVIEACHLADALDKVREVFLASLNPSDGRLMVSLSKQYLHTLGTLGFGPVARTNMGLAEVTAASKMDKLRRSNVEKASQVEATLVRDV